MPRAQRALVRTTVNFFAPVARYETVRTVLAVACAVEGLYLQQFDVKTASVRICQGRSLHGAT